MKKEQEVIKVVGYYKCKKCNYKFKVDYIYPNKEQAKLHKPRPLKFCDKCGKKPRGSKKPKWTAKLIKAKE